ncbi:MAG: DUF2306 domain-containing protein [Comamonadaceae bacterium]|nr:DUF2306 domain-containing protein [Comamonadaceae bacterium]
MTLAPLLAAPAVIQLHTAAAFVALAAVVAQLAGRKAGVRHWITGWVFVVAMGVTAVSSLWITGIFPGRYSPIHLLTLLTLVMLPLGVWYRRAGNLAGHRKTMLGLTAGLVGAGLFTLMPGRILFQSVFGG